MAGLCHLLFLPGKGQEGHKHRIAGSGVGEGGLGEGWEWNTWTPVGAAPFNKKKTLIQFNIIKIHTIGSQCFFQVYYILLFLCIFIPLIFSTNSINSCY